MKKNLKIFFKKYAKKKIGKILKKKKIEYNLKKNEKKFEKKSHERRESLRSNIVFCPWPPLHGKIFTL